MAGRRTAWSFREGCGTFENVLEVDRLAVQEIVDALDPEWEDPLLTPWRRSHSAAIRAALGH